MKLTKVDLRWSDLDPNLHVRHSVYYDWGTNVRMNFLQDLGCTVDEMRKQLFGPIIFREEAVFKKEILISDTIHLNVSIIKATQNFSKWTMQHEIFKNENILAAVLTIDGAWMDLQKRKLTIPPQFIIDAFNEFPKPESFCFID